MKVQKVFISFHMSHHDTSVQSTICMYTYVYIFILYITRLSFLLSIANSDKEIYMNVDKAKV